MSQAAKSLVLVLIALALSMAQGGCIVLAAGAGAGTAAYVIGDLEEVVSASPQQLAQASAEALEALELTLISKTASNLEAEVIGRTSDDKKITIKIKRVGDTASSVSVRVGAFGDKERNRQILDEIKNHI